eukprot:4135381-Pyramimonas_sp.AAC.1
MDACVGASVSRDDRRGARGWWHGFRQGGRPASCSVVGTSSGDAGVGDADVVVGAVVVGVVAVIVSVVAHVILLVVVVADVGSKGAIPADRLPFCFLRLRLQLPGGCVRAEQKS